ncbi:FAD-dependent oxidoreductase [Arthrobacter agilis]|nr:FAD-dependent oxidoreductase [Arthrobacter agilis]TPV22501.1 FAD-dependent oxidoreductase [Arthrobacter agilis]
MKSSQNIIDLLVVGGGTAGIVGARTAARLGARTVLVERSRTGGDCLWTGCVPSKTLLSAAAGRRVHDETDEDYFRTVRTRITAAITTIEPDDAPETLEAAGVEVRSGRLRFTASGTAELDGVTVRFRQALVATGSEPFLPEIPGLGDARYVTSETIWDLAELPSRLVIIGGGPIACEIGQAFGRLGSRVTMLVRSEILPKEDREAAAIVRESLRHDGVTILEQTGTSRVEVDTAAVGRVRGGCAGPCLRRLAAPRGRDPGGGRQESPDGRPRTREGRRRPRRARVRDRRRGDADVRPDGLGRRGRHAASPLHPRCGVPCEHRRLQRRPRGTPRRPRDHSPGHLHLTRGGRRGTDHGRRAGDAHLHGPPRRKRPRHHGGPGTRFLAPGHRTGRADPGWDDRGPARGGVARRTHAGGQAKADHARPRRCHPRLSHVQRQPLERRHSGRRGNAGQGLGEGGHVRARPVHAPTRRPGLPLRADLPGPSSASSTAARVTGRAVTRSPPHRRRGTGGALRGRDRRIGTLRSLACLATVAP